MAAATTRRCPTVRTFGADPKFATGRHTTCRLARLRIFAAAGAMSGDRSEVNFRFWRRTAATGEGRFAVS